MLKKDERRISIGDLDFTNRVKNCLTSRNILTPYHLRHWCEHQLALITGMGEESIRNLKMVTQKLGIQLNSLPSNDAQHKCRYCRYLLQLKDD